MPQVVACVALVFETILELETFILISLVNAAEVFPPVCFYTKEKFIVYLLFLKIM